MQSSVSSRSSIYDRKLQCMVTKSILERASAQRLLAILPEGSEKPPMKLVKLVA